MLSRTAEPNVVGMETGLKQKRRRYSAAERQQLLAAWHSSGESAARFGQRHDVHASNLVRWSGQAGVQAGARRKKRATAGGFVELRAVGEPIGVARDVDQADLIVEYPNGLKLRASRHVDVDALAQLATTLGAIRAC